MLDVCLETIVCNYCMFNQIGKDLMIAKCQCRAKVGYDSDSKISECMITKLTECTLMSIFIFRRHI